LAEKTAATGLSEVIALLSKDKVYLHAEPFLSNGDIAEIRVRRYYHLDAWGSGDVDEGVARVLGSGSLPSLARYAISVIFNKEGAGRLRSIALEHRGSPVAILIDGEVILTFGAVAPSSDDDSIQLSYQGVTKELGERLDRLLSRGCFTPGPDCTGALINRESGKPAVRIELRLAEGSPARSLTEAVVECSRERIYLRPELLATNEDIASAQAVSSRIAGLFDVNLTFNEECAQRLAKATGAAKRGRLAILINGKVIMAPTFGSPISSKAILSGFVSMETAEKIASAARKR
jgi:preprotein translocase subunit SecD